MYPNRVLISCLLTSSNCNTYFTCKSIPSQFSSPYSNSSWCLLMIVGCKIAGVIFLYKTLHESPNLVGEGSTDSWSYEVTCTLVLNPAVPSSFSSKTDSGMPPFMNFLISPRRSMAILQLYLVVMSTYKWCIKLGYWCWMYLQLRLNR